jgi:hypothetical protein
VNLNAAALKVMVAKGLTLEDVAEIVAAGEEGCKPQSSAAKRQARYRQRKQEGVTNNVTDDVTPPLKDKLKTPSSEPNGSGCADPIKEMFDVGVALLVSTGSTDKQARSLIGKWRKAKGDGEVLTALLDCRARAIAQPVEWLERRFKVSKWVSASGHEYRGSDEDALREAERRNDMDTYWRIKGAMSREKRAA